MSATKATTPAEARAAAGAGGRPETNPNGTITALGRIYPFRSAKGPLVGFGSACPGGADVIIKPHEARQAAAVLVAYADAAEPEPDPAEVAALESVLREATGRHEPDDTMTGLARAVLLAGWKREASRG